MREIPIAITGTSIFKFNFKNLRLKNIKKLFQLYEGFGKTLLINFKFQRMDTRASLENLLQDIT